MEVAEQEGLEPPTLSGSRFQGGVFIQPGLLHRGRLQERLLYQMVQPVKKIAESIVTDEDIILNELTGSDRPVKKRNF